MSDIADISEQRMQQEAAIREAAIAERQQKEAQAIQSLGDNGQVICDDCGEDIPAARLAAFPHAVLCVACKAADELRNKGVA